MAEKEFTCPVEGTLSMIGGKYKSIILYHLMKETLRYSEWTDTANGLSGCAAKDRV